ncbi:MAG: adenosylcobinamide-phosphate synthase CbiB [Clostridiales bacterium]|nr:adenosylcobinamide-phosphate synthase CbiB [Clostridiales bacterium]
MRIVLWSSGALLTGFVLDMIFGDPYGFPHIVRWMGSFIAALDKRLPRTVFGGVLLVILTTSFYTGLPFTLLSLCYRFVPSAGYVLESFLCWQLLAVKQLKVESMKVYHSLLKNDLGEARKNVAMIVGRDTAMLDEKGITRAAVETVAENASDGVTAPLLFIMLGGAALGCLYKVVNTMDSMVGYKNENYLHFGRAAAKLDDALNYLPSRLCALLMIAAAFPLGLNGKDAFRVWRRDRYKHASPNSAQTEAVCAGALGIRLAGPISYFGKTQDKPYIGDETRPIQADDILKANRLMYAAGVLTLLFTIFFRLGVLRLAAI